MELTKYKIPELKALAKKYSLKVSGTKPVLLERIREHILREKSATIIQRIFRGHMVRYVMKHMAYAHKCREMCVNECDGCTLEPLSNIPFLRLFTCKDEKDFNYGFDIISLLTIYTKCNTINPYTREQMNASTVNTVKTLGRLLLILFPEMIDKGERNVIDMYSPVIRRLPTTSPTQPHAATTRGQPVRLYRPQYNTHNHHGQNRNLVLNAFTRRTMSLDNISLFINMIRENLTENEYSLFNKLIEIRRLPIYQRIQEVFIEIDLLGNYTQSSWFSNLTTLEYCHFFNHLHQIWSYGANLSPEIKQQICILHDPFLNLRTPNYMIISNDVAKELCTTVIENIVYGSLDQEYRKLGCMYVLTALTLVSREARHNLYWLYESVV